MTVWACSPGVGMALSKTCGAAGSCTINWQHRQAHLPRIWRCTKNCAGTMSRRSLMSSPTRTIGLPHSGVGQFVSSGSTRWSTRGRCGGRASRLGWQAFRPWGCWSGAAPLPSAGAGCRAASWASKLAWSAAHVSSNSARCWAFMASVLAPNFQAFSRASWNVMLWILASRHLMACACESMRLLCSPMWASIRAANSASSPELSVLRSWVLIACTSSMQLLCNTAIQFNISEYSNCI